jgi:hypothetical protein
VYFVSYFDRCLEFFAVFRNCYLFVDLSLNPCVGVVAAGCNDVKISGKWLAKQQYIYVCVCVCVCISVEKCISIKFSNACLAF